MLYSVVRQEVESIFNLGVGRKYVLHWIDIYPGHENRTSSDVPKQLFCFLFGFFQLAGLQLGNNADNILGWAALGEVKMQ